MYQRASFLKATARCEYLSLNWVPPWANVFRAPLGMNIGSNPKPCVPADLCDIVPCTFPENSCDDSLGDARAKEAWKYASRRVCRPIKRKSPPTPMVWWTYDEKGPGKPFRTLTKSPESSTTTARLCFLAASFAANLAISPRLVLWISVFGEASMRIFIPNGSRVLRASWYL